MNEILNRYSKIKTKFPREFILLQGKGCFWKKCTFCDYFEDISNGSIKINSETLNKVTGEFGILDIINSGSAMELDEETIELILKKSKEKNIKEIWFEAHWAYRNKLKQFAKKFKDIKIKFRTGVETFNPVLRNDWKKGIEMSVTPTEISKFFNGVCLLIGIKDQSLEDICNDINIAVENFERVTVNVFVNNSTNTQKDVKLINTFVEKLYPKIKNNKKIEILIDNKDLGVG